MLHIVHSSQQSAHQLSIITKRGNLSEIVVEKLSERIGSGIYRPGEKLPSSAQFGEEFGVSRTVIY